MSEVSHQEKRLKLSWALKDLYSMPGDAHGNVSVRVSKHEFLIKPSGKKECTLSELCLVRIVAYGGGMPPTVKVEEGNRLRPSVDTVHHASLYANHEWLGAICHTHSDYVVAHAVAGKDIDCLSTEQADIFGGKIHCHTYWSLDEWGMRVHLTPNDPAVLLGRHGGLTFADDPQKAVQLAMRLEDVARKNYLANTLKASCCGIPQMDEKEIAKWRKRYLKGYGQRKS